MKHKAFKINQENPYHCCCCNDWRFWPEFFCRRPAGGMSWCRLIFPKKAAAFLGTSLRHRFCWEGYAGAHGQGGFPSASCGTVASSVSAVIALIVGVAAATAPQKLDHFHELAH